MKTKFTVSFFFIVLTVCLAILSINLHALSLHSSDKLSLKGELVQGGIVFGKTVPGSQVFFDKQLIRVSAYGDFIIAFNRDEPQIVTLKVVTLEGDNIDKELHVNKRIYDIQHIDGLPEAKVSPKKRAVIERIREEAALASMARKRDDDRLDYMETFIWPVTGPLSGVYGSQRVLNGKARRPHYGVDVAAPVGTDVFAPASGVITLVHPDMFYSGGTIILDHGHGLSSTFLHLSQILVKKGALVKQGDLIAKVGATGRATGAHLDWRMNLFKRRIDPQRLVPAMENPLNSNKKIKYVN